MVLALAGAKLPQPYVHFRAAIGEMLPFMHAMPSMQLVIVAGADEDYERERGARWPNTAWPTSRCSAT